MDYKILIYYHEYDIDGVRISQKWYDDHFVNQKDYVGIYELLSK